MDVGDTLTAGLLPNLLGRPIPHAAEILLARLLGLPKLQELYQALRGGDLPARLIAHLGVECSISENDIGLIPCTGASVLIANHPFGILDGAVFARVLSRVRPDAKFLANPVLENIPEIRDLLISIDPFSRKGSARTNARGATRALEHLENGGLLVAFPAGEVAHWQFSRRAVADPEWKPGIVRLISTAERRGLRLTIVPAHITGANSWLFQIAGVIHPSARTALLGRELLNKRRMAVEVRIGKPFEGKRLLQLADSDRVAYLRWRTDLLAARQPFKARTRAPLLSRRQAEAEVIAPAVDSSVLAKDVEALPEEALLASSGDLAVYIARAAQLPGVLHEIGRLREITFRMAGEGTGKATDLDRFDADYLHLFVWNHRKQEVAGAYRIGRVDVLRGKHGINGLYTATLFRFGPDFVDQLGMALELGRSFVRPEYQRSFSALLLLWKGVGRFVARHPRYSTLFGPISISNSYRTESRQIMVSFLERFAGLSSFRGLVSPRKRFRPASRLPELARSGAGLELEDLSAAVSDLESAEAGVPVLLRQYLNLGGRLIAFNIDRNFSDALDGLIVVDLTRTDRKLLDRYLGHGAAAAFLNSQRGQSWTITEHFSSPAGSCGS